ncbi:MAG: signal peptidase I [Tenericutes bacterium]|nr:signal peptidase I [Mycoplasmatota bacterium]
MENNLMHEQLNEETKLMKKIKILLISFFFITIIDVVLFTVFQNHPLFIFKLNRSSENISAYGSYQLISYILYSTILLFFIGYILLLVTYIKERKNDETDYELVRKRYGFFDFFTVIPTFFLAMMIINGLFFSLAVVDGESMAPTYCSTDVVLISYLSGIERDDIIVFDKEDFLYIKRVVGLPGDTLVVNSSGVYINGDYIEDSFGNFFYDGTIEDGYYFVLGDNRDNSLDSRSDRVGLIKENELIGPVILDLTNRDCQID